MSPLVIDLHEWEERSPENDSSLAGITLGNDPAVRDIARELTRAGVVEIIELRSGLRLKTSSYVGRLQLGDLHLTIRPKIPFDPLLTLLRYAFNLRNLKLFSDAEYSIPPDAFQELLIHQLAAEANELITRGLQRRYVQVNDYLPAPRGRIDVQRVARQSDIVEATIPCTYYPRLEDSLVNQVLLAGLHLASRLTNDLLLRTKLRRLAAIIEENVTRIMLNGEVMRHLDRQLNRLTAAYEPALTLIALLLQSSGITLDDSQAVLPLPGFLFDMNHFFEALMSRFLRENLRGYTVIDQYRLRGMMAYRPDYNPQRRKSPTPRPDYVVTRDGRMAAMLDAKYRDIWTNGLPRDMLYQLAIYARSQDDDGSAAILYPTLEPLAKPEIIDINEVFYGEHRGQVIMRPVNLERLEQLITGTGVQAERERAVFAAYLVFGEQQIFTAGRR
jgi:5-methylcytosine-specific restriction enzyme subunit McrC